MARPKKQPENPISEAEIVVVGGGAVGTVSAIALARAGRSVVLLAPGSPRRDGRTVALMQGSVDLLQRLDLWQGIEGESAPLERLRIIDDSGSLFRPPPVTFSAREIDQDAFARNVETATLVQHLLREARAIETLTVLDAGAAAIELTSGGAVVTTASGMSLDARLVIGADGRRSLVREAAGLATREWRYRQSALTTILSHSRPHQDISTEFHTREGPFTLVPLPGNRSSLVWVMAPGRAEALQALPDDALAAAIERQAHAMLGQMTIDGPRGCVPLSGLSVSKLIGDRAALVGEAAHVFPPIGAQGLNLGFRDVEALVRAVGSAADPGAPEILAAYDRARRTDVASRTAMVDVLDRTLLADFLPADFMRGAGLLALDLIGPLRRFVMREGMAPRLGRRF